MKKSRKLAWVVLGVVLLLLLAAAAPLAPTILDRLFYEKTSEKGWPSEAPRAWFVVYRHRWDGHEQCRLYDASGHELYRNELVRLSGRGFAIGPYDTINVTIRLRDNVELVWEFTSSGEVIPPPNPEYKGPPWNK